MNGKGAGFLPKDITEFSDAPDSFTSGTKLWWRYSHSAQRTPPRLLLVVLLSSQILFLAIVRLGPGASVSTLISSVDPSPPSSGASALLVGQGGRKIPPLQSLHQENGESLYISYDDTNAPPPLPSSSAYNVKDNKDLTTASEGNMPVFQAVSTETPLQGSPFKKRKKKKNKGKSSSSSLQDGSNYRPSFDDSKDKAGQGVFTGKSDTVFSLGEKRSGDGLLVNDKVDKTPSISESIDLLPSSMELARRGAHLKSKSSALEERTSVTDDITSSKPEDKGDVANAEVEPSREAHNAAAMTTFPDEAKREQTLLGEAGVAFFYGGKARTESLVQDEQSTKSEIGRPNIKSKPVLIVEQASDAEERVLAKDSLRKVEQTYAYVEGKVTNDVDATPEIDALDPVIAQAEESLISSSQCEYGYIYVYNLPPVFNHDIIDNCTALNPWLDVCATLLNGGLGDSLSQASPLGQIGSWFISDQFTAEVVFHDRILQHPCLTDKWELASGFYVPYYAGLDVGRYLWLDYTAEQRDQVGNQLLEWLAKQQPWKKSQGWDHFMMIGRITWDFRRSRDEDWGSGFFYHPLMRNTTRLLIEKNPWDYMEMAVPYPTNFHPQSDADLRAWQNHIRGLSRLNLFSFAGAPRSAFPNDFRAILLDQCSRAQSCQALDCSNRTCDTNQKTLELFMDSIFCLQPRGDSFTRRSTFDCLLAGSIPVFFWRRSAYMQYKWHLPDDVSSYSVFIPKQDMMNGTIIEDVLNGIPFEKVKAMQETVIQMVPRVVYAASGSSLKEERDAFDVAIEGVMKKFRELS